MALMKMISESDELIFPLKGKAPEANEISVILSDRAGKMATFKIAAHRSIPIEHYKHVLNYEEQGVIRTLGVGEELVFDVRNANPEECIFLYFMERMRGRAIIKITTEKSTRFSLYRQHTIRQ